MVFLLPVLLVLVTAVLHYGLLYYVILDVHSAVSSAATYAAYHPTDDSGIQGAVRKSLSPVIAQGDVTVALFSYGSRKFGKLLTLRVDYDVSFLRSFPFGAFFPAPTRVSSRLTFTILS
ncbi:MAG: hypothetical protein HY303_21415 [Candidatus Wallbacteria bacterium]|nr:hypothetical protein [Candidatus Wallbacteria bacterium]